jgi:hypothetical protein
VKGKLIGSESVLGPQAVKSIPCEWKRKEYVIDRERKFHRNREIKKEERERMEYRKED